MVGIGQEIQIHLLPIPACGERTYRNGKAEELTGDPGWPVAKALADHVEDYLWTPLPRAGVAANASYRLQQRTMGEIVLTCLQPQSMEVSQLGDSVTLLEMNANRVPTTCFSDGLPVVRMEIMRDGVVVAMNQIMEHDGHYIAKQIVLYDAGQQVVVLNVEQLEFPASISDAEMPKPDEAPVKEDAGRRFRIVCWRSGSSATDWNIRRRHATRNWLHLFSCPWISIRMAE